MPLLDHFRELRTRVLIASAAILAGSAPGWYLYEPLLNELSAPLLRLGGKINYALLIDPFMMQLQTALSVGLVLSSPIWLYQLWAFIVPALTRREKWTSLIFLFTATPLFICGCYLGYLVLPNAVGILLGFTPHSGDNILDAGQYLTFVTRLVVAFGLSFLMPVFLVALNMVRVLPAQVMLKSWRIAVVLLFILSAILTPTPDPWTMFLLAGPLCCLYFAAIGISMLLERSRRQPKPSADITEREHV